MNAFSLDYMMNDTEQPNQLTVQQALSALPLFFQHVGAFEHQQINADMADLSHACCTPVQDDEDLARRMNVIDSLFDLAQSEDELPAILAHMVTDRVYQYEQATVVLPEVPPSEALAVLMSEKGVKQKDLATIAGQSIISEILNGKRKMTVEHIKGFARFFNVPEKTFLG